MGEQCPETKLNAEKVFNPNLRGWVIAMQNEPTLEGARHGGTMGNWLLKLDSLEARLLHCKVVTPIGKGFSLGCVPEEAVELSMGSPKNPSADLQRINPDQ